jgi:hypothetical protein
MESIDTKPHNRQAGKAPVVPGSDAAELVSLCKRNAHNARQAELLRHREPPGPVVEPSPELERKRAMRLDAFGRAEFFARSTVHTDAVAKAHSVIDLIVAQQGKVKYPGGAWLIGPGGVGKSFIADLIARRYPSVDDGVDYWQPILNVRLGHTPKPEQLTRRLLAGLGRTVVGVYNEDQFDAFLVQALQQSGVRLLIVEQAHQMYPVTSTARVRDRISGTVGDYLNAVYDKTGIGILLVGTPGLLDWYAADPQLSTRWSAMIHLNNMNYDDTFVAVLQTLDELAPIDEQASLASPRISSAIHNVTGGNFRALKMLLRQALIFALQDRSCSIKDVHLSHACLSVFGPDTLFFKGK